MGATVTGTASLERKLRVLPDAAREMIAPAMEASAQDVVDLARSLVPTHRGVLRASIDWTWGDAPKGSIVLGRVRSTGRGAGNMQITVFAGNEQAYYARWVEFGTKPHTNAGSHKGTHNPGTAARPFFYPAYRAVKKKVKSRVSRAVTKSAKQVAASG